MCLTDCSASQRKSSAWSSNADVNADISNILTSSNKNIDATFFSGAVMMAPFLYMKSRMFSIFALGLTPVYTSTVRLYA